MAGHVSLDVFPELPGPVTLEPGRLVVVGPAALSTGGAVANVGVALHRLGVRVGLVARVGDDLFGRAVRERLTASGRGLAAGITTVAGEATSYTIVISPPGVDRSFLHCPGANATFTADDVPDSMLAGVRLFHFGYPPLMPRMYADGGQPLRAMFARAQAAGAVTSLDLCVPDPHSHAGRVDWERVLAAALPHVDVFAPSIVELLFIFDPPAHRRLDAGAPLATVIGGAVLERLGAALLDLGAAVVAIKLGDQGLYLRTGRERAEEVCRRLGLSTATWREGEVLAPCWEPASVAGTTGAGDATIAGLLTAMLRGCDLSEAAAMATAVGACSVEAVDPVSGIPHWMGVARRVAEGWPRRTSDLGAATGSRG